MKKNINFIVFKYLLLFLITLSSISGQRNYYFSSSTGNDANDGSSPQKAKKSLAWLYENYILIQPGDSILLKRGDRFAERTVPHTAHLHIRELIGTSSQRIVVGAYGSGNNPVVSNENYQDAYAFRMRGGVYFTIQDIDFIGGALFDPHLTIGSTEGLANVKILRCNFKGVTRRDYTGFMINSSYNHLVKPDPTFSQNGITYKDLSIGRPVHNIEIGYCKVEYSLHGFNINYVDYNLHFHNNKALNNGGDGFDVGGGEGHLIEYNTIIGNYNAGIKVHSQKAVLKNSIIRGNLIVKSTSQSAVILQHVENCQIYNNSFIDDFSAMFGNRDRWLWAPDISNFDIYTNRYVESGTYATYYGTFKNNEIFNNIFSGVIQIQGVWDDIVVTDNLVGRNRFYNNLYTYNHSSVGVNDNIFMRHWDVVASPGKWDGKNSIDPVYEVGYKLTTSNFENNWRKKTSPTEIYSTNVNAVFTNPVYSSYTNYGDYRLKTGSPAIGAGVYVPGYNKDINGNPIPAGSPSIGAFEYNTLPQDLIKPKLQSVIVSTPNELTLTFSEIVESSSASNKNNYSISNGITITSVTVISGTQVRLQTSTHPAGNYSVTVTNVYDPAGNIIDNTANSLSYIITSVDNIPPKLISAAISNSSIVILTFSEQITAVSAENKNNYSISNGITINSVTVISGTQVRLQTSTHPAGNYSVTVTNVYDPAGNIIDNTANSLSYIITSVDNIPPKLISAAISNSSIVILTFSEQITAVSAENKNNYFINNGISIVSAKLNDDKKSVTLSTTQHISSSYTITVNNVADLAGNLIDVNNNSTTYNYSIPDTEEPKLLLASLTDSETLDITFSKSMNTGDMIVASNYTINNIQILSASVLASDKVRLKTTKHSSGVYQVTVNNLKDLAGNLISSAYNKFTYTYQEPDTLAPRLLSVDIKDSVTVEIEFSEIITKSSSENISNYIISPEIQILSSRQMSQLNKVQLKTNSHQTGEYELSASNISDLSGNVIDEDYKKIKYSFVKPDLTEPRLSRVEIIDSVTLIIEFSEAVNEVDAANNENYAITEDISVLVIERINEIQFRLTTTEHITGSYQIIVTNVRDLSGNIISDSYNKIIYNYVKPDNEPPMLTSVSILDSITVIVEFSESMDKVKAEDITNYSISDNIVINDSELLLNGRNVKLTTSVHKQGSYTLEVNAVTDEAGNIINPDYRSLTYSFIVPDTLSPKLISVTILDSSLIELTFNESMFGNDLNDLQNYYIDGIQILIAEQRSDIKKVRLHTTPHKTGNYLLTVKRLRDLAGNFIDPEFNSFTYNYEEPDRTRPKLLSTIAISSTELLVEFSESMRNYEVENINNYRIDMLNIISADYIDTNKVKLITSEHFNGEHILFVNNVRDLTGNLIDPENNSALYFYTDDNILPSLIGVRAGDLTNVTLTFSEKMDTVSLLNIQNYEIDKGIQILDAVMISDSIVLLKTENHDYEVVYNIKANNVKDINRNYIDSSANQINYTIDNVMLNLMKENISSAAASLFIRYEATPDKAVDGLGFFSGDNTSRWAASLSPQWILLDLGESKEISLTRVSFFKWNEGVVYQYSVQISEDSNFWLEIVSPKLSGNEEWSVDKFFPQNARFVKFFIQPVNGQNIDEVSIWETEVWTANKVTSVDETSVQLLDYELSQNYPNPFNPTTTITYTLKEDQFISLSIYNVLGEMISKPISGFFRAGKYNYIFEAHNLPSGIYFYKLDANNYSDIKKMILLK